MFTKSDKIIFTCLGLAGLVALLSWNDLKAVVKGKEFQREVSGKKNNKKGMNDKEETRGSDVGISIIQKWEMPASLKEISGLGTIDETYLACIQDELGTIFIFNTSTGKVDKEIPFGAAGDYEGISIVGPDAWVMRSDGTLFEVQGYNSTKLLVKEYITGFTSKQDVESLCYDQKNNRLLLAIKGRELNSDNYKGIYAFNLTTKKMAAEPVYKINFTHEIWNDVRGKYKMQPSALDIHPVTGSIYILDGHGSRLLVMSASGKDQKLYQLDRNDFSQPEGLTFTPSGQLYVSNEGRRTGIGNILKLSMEESR